eukprot:gene10305-13851_t
MQLNFYLRYFLSYWILKQIFGVSSQATSLDFASVQKVVYNTMVHDTKQCEERGINLPYNGVIITMSSFESFKYVELQWKSMEFWSKDLRDCLMKKSIVVCTDKRCFSKCNNGFHTNCALLDLGDLPESSGAVCSTSYGMFIYIKHEVMQQALMVTNEIFFMDSDVLIFGNPWIPEIYSFNKNGERVLNNYDMMYQRDFGYSDTCSGTRIATDINSGQLYIKNSSAVQNYFKIMMSHKMDIITCKDRKTDQDYISSAALTANMSLCGLDRYRFASVCQVYYKQTNNDGKFRNIITFHFAGIVGMMKYHQSIIFMKKVKMNPDILLGNILITKDFFMKQINNTTFNQDLEEFEKLFTNS